MTMTWSRFKVRAILSLMVLAAVGACATVSKEPTALRDAIFSEHQAIASLKQQEESSPEDAAKSYEKTLKDQAELKQPFQDYQSKLKDALTAMEDQKQSTTLPEDAMLGLPGVYAERLMTIAEARQGLGRIFLAKGQFVDAEQHVTASIDLMKNRAHSPVFSSKSLVDGYAVLQDIYAKQGLTGKAMVAKLNGDLLKDYLESKGGREDEEFEKNFFFGDGAQKQLDSIQEFVESVNKVRKEQARSKQMALLSGLMYVGAAYQQVQATQMLAKSGGVMTPDVQLAQINAQNSMMQAHMFTTLVAQRESSAKSVDNSSLSSVLPSLSQQIVDPRVSVNAPGIVKGFASRAFQAGGSSYESGAQQVIQGVDSLASYRQAGVSDSSAERTRQFVDLFANFVSQVQAIRASQQ